MTKRTVQAVRAADGHLKLLEEVSLPPGTPITVTIELPDSADAKEHAALLPTRSLGALRGRLSRDEIYDDLV